MRSKDLTPKTNILFNIAKKYSNHLYGVRKRIVSFILNSAQAEKLSNSILKIVENVNDATYMFIESQIKKSKITPWSS